MKKISGITKFKNKIKEIKAYCIVLCSIAFLVCFAYALGYFGIVNLHAMRFWMDDSSSEKPQTDLADLTVEIYVQNAESGEYELKENKYLSVELDVAFEYEPIEKIYYQVNNELSSLIATSPDDETVLQVYYECETCIVTFSGGEDSDYKSGLEEQVIRKGQTPIAPEYYKKGWQVTHYEPQLKKTYQDTVYTAQWQEKEITVTLNLTFGAIIEAEDFVKDSYNLNCYTTNFLAVSDEDLILPIPTLEGYEFKGWYSTASGEGEPCLKIEQGTDENVLLYSVFNAITYEMSFVMDSNYSDYQFQSIVAPAGVLVQPPIIPPSMQIPGYGLNWYVDEDYTELYTFTVMPNENVVLYGVWEEDVGEGIFGLEIRDKVIDSEEEFILFLEVNAFMYNTSWIDRMEVSFATKEEIEENLINYLAKAEYPITIFNQIKLEVEEGTGKLFVTANLPLNWKNEEASLTTDKTEVTPYGYFINNYGSREDYLGFYIDGLPTVIKSGRTELTISTSNQLIYLVEHGYKPLCEKDSDAERVYLEARKVLNSIIGEDFTDYQKMLAIFDYLALNVQYDENATKLGREGWAKYDAFALEGVFDNGKAVCDGISKAFSLMCNIEGIPCVRVRGNNHAWCKVKINNRWTVVDPTHGNTQINDTEKSVIAHEFLSMTDEQKSELGYSSNDYANIVADYAINYYENAYFTYEGIEHDLVMENASDISLLLDYCATQDEIVGKVIDFYYIGDLKSLEEYVTAEIRTFMRKYELNGIMPKFNYRESEYGIVVRIMFEGVEEENAKKIR